MRRASTRPTESLAIDLVAGWRVRENAKPVAETMQALAHARQERAPGLAPRRRPPAGRDQRGDGVGSPGRRFPPGEGPGRDRLRDSSACMASPPSTSPKESGSWPPPCHRPGPRPRRAQSVNNLKQIGLAFHNFELSQQPFPGVGQYGDKGKFPYSWRVAILPYIEQQELYNQYHFDEPWDGPNNRKLIDKMPAIYAYPGPDGGPSSRSHTSYFVFDGPADHWAAPKAGRRSSRSPTARRTRSSPSRRSARSPGPSPRISPSTRTPPCPSWVDSRRTASMPSSPTDRCVTSRSRSIRWS